MLARAARHTIIHRGALARAAVPHKPLPLLIHRARAFSSKTEGEASSSEAKPEEPAAAEAEAAEAEAAADGEAAPSAEEELQAKIEDLEAQVASKHDQVLAATQRLKTRGGARRSTWRTRTSSRWASLPSRSSMSPIISAAPPRAFRRSCERRTSSREQTPTHTSSTRFHASLRKNTNASLLLFYALAVC